MNDLSLGDLKNSELPAQVNLCKDDPKFVRRVNRALEWLLYCGSFNGTTRLMHICVYDRCVVTPGCVANLEGVRGCHQALRIESNWYRMMNGYNPHSWETEQLWFEYYDNVPTFRQLHAARILRVFASDPSDYGKTIKFLGYDNNGIWVRTKQGGVMQDGEVVVMATPFTDTVIQFSSVTAVLKAETDSVVRVFSHPFGDDTLTPLGTYEYWETKPSYQRYRVNGNNNLDSKVCKERCMPLNTVEAEIKLAFIPVKHDDDILPITNRIGMELAVMGVKALDDGDIARSDLLLYGDGQNKRMGAIPILNQEIRTNTGDRFAAYVRVGGPCGFKTIMRGMI